MQHFTPICKIPHHHNGGYKRPKLSELLLFYNISEQEVQQAAQELFQAHSINAHDARYDTAALYLVMQKHQSEKITNTSL